MPLRKPLFVPAPPETALGRWLMGGESHESGGHAPAQTYPWWKVIWLTGVDYFSTLGYQPGIALLAAGAVSPIATLILVAVTLAGALPVYAQVATRSFAGQGSIAMLENLLEGWWSKLLVLVLLGFAATDFVITMTLSAADAAKHAIENPYLHHVLEGHEIGLTSGLLVLLAVVFLLGFSEAIGLATLVAVPYIGLNFVVLGRCLYEIAQHPEYLARWKGELALRGDPLAVAAVALLVFPKLALGLSGFETGVAVMPLVDGGPWDVRRLRREGQSPLGRIAATKKLLAAAALLMSVLLILSSFSTTLLIGESDYREGGKASGRALAFLAHQFFGNGFGTLYDGITILILWLAGASAMAGLLHLIPRYLPRFGMAPEWAAHSRPLVLILLVITILVTLAFRANVEAQSGAYATGVLVLILSAAVAAALALKKDGRTSLSYYCWAIAVVFFYTLVDNCIERPDGLIIGGIFIFITLTVSGLSRYLRSTELRISQVTLADEATEALQEEIIGRKVHLVPVRTNHHAARARKRFELERYYNVDGPLCFLHVSLLDNRSEFVSPLEIEIRRDEIGDYVVEIFHAPAVANAIAYFSELIDPKSIFIGLTRQNLMQQATRYLMFGEGETGLMVYTILLKYWESTPEDDLRPVIHLLSD